MFSGKNGSLLFDVNGTLATGRLGTSVDGVGDVNGDNVPDIIAGAPNAPSLDGRAFVFSGVNGSVLTGSFRSR